MKAPFTRGNACAAFSPEDFAALVNAASKYRAAHRGFFRVISFVAARVGDASKLLESRLGSTVGPQIRDKIVALAEEALTKGFGAATLWMDSSADSERWVNYHKFLATASGAGGGMLGAAGVLADATITTGIMMRSIADIARAFPDEDLRREDTRLACIEVFSFGETIEGGEDAGATYWTTRNAIQQATIREALKIASARLGSVLSQKALAQIVPLAGAVAGASINYAFLEYFQDIARIHFTIRDLERRYPEADTVKVCFEHLLGQIA